MYLLSLAGLQKRLQEHAATILHKVTNMVMCTCVRCERRSSWDAPWVRGLYLVRMDHLFEVLTNELQVASWASTQARTKW